jgi:Holliday junction resolvase
MSHYARGATFERSVAAKLAADGYWVARAAGSHGKADIVGLKRGQVLLVQCKLSGPGGVSPAEWNELYAIAEQVGAIALVAHKPARGRIEFLRMTAVKTGVKGTRPPCEPWTTDELGEVAA